MACYNCVPQSLALKAALKSCRKKDGQIIHCHVLVLSPAFVSINCGCDLCWFVYKQDIIRRLKKCYATVHCAITEYQSEVDTARFHWHFVPLSFCQTHHQGGDIQRECVWSVLAAHSLAVGFTVIFLFTLSGARRFNCRDGNFYEAQTLCCCT